jgi:hypothetical protein
MSGAVSHAVLAALAKLTSVQFFASATDSGASTDTLALPAGIRAGDVIVLMARDKRSSNSTPPSEVVPTGYTLINSFSDNGSDAQRVIFSYRVADGTETVIPTYTNNKTNTRRIVLVFRPNAVVTTVTPAGFQSQMTAGDPTAQVIGSGSGSSPLVVFGFYLNNTGGYEAGNEVNPRTASPAFDAEVSHTNWLWFNYKIYNSAPANVTIDMDDEGSLNGLASFYIQFA